MRRIMAFAGAVLITMLLAGCGLKAGDKQDYTVFGRDHGYTANGYVNCSSDHYCFLNALAEGCRNTVFVDDYSSAENPRVKTYENMTNSQTYCQIIVEYKYPDGKDDIYNTTIALPLVNCIPSNESNSGYIGYYGTDGKCKRFSTF